MPRTFVASSLSALLWVLCALGTAPGAIAAERPMVYGIVPPAWVERQGRILPLRLETLILDGDEVRTGPGGRVELDLPDGSAVKLGATTRLALPSSRMRRVADDDVFESALHLLKGAFRFTTHLAGKAMKRDLRLRVGAVTIGIRGTDLMIVTGDDGDHIMLVEGRIELVGEGMAAPMMMEQPMDLMMFSPSGLMSHPAMEREAMMGEMHAMEAMVAMPSGGGMLMMGMAPVWDVVVMSFQDPVRAAPRRGRLAGRGRRGTGVRSHLASRRGHRLPVEGRGARFRGAGRGRRRHHRRLAETPLGVKSFSFHGARAARRERKKT